MRGILGLLAFMGRAAQGFVRLAPVGLTHVHGVWSLFLKTNYLSFVGPFTGRTKMRRQLFLMLSSVGVSSVPIVFVVSFLMGAIMILQSGEPLKQFGQIQEAPGAVAWTLTREISPLITSIIITARVGASFTAVLASMKINEEILALETMAINPIGHLPAPRHLSMIDMPPCLTVTSHLVGMIGGALVANAVYDISYSIYISKTVAYLNMTDIVSGLVKSAVFGVLITMICCYFGLKTEGGSVGLGRNIMVAVVTAIVFVITADALATAVINNYVL